MVSFKEQGFPDLTKYSLCIFSLVACIFDVISKKTLPTAGSQRFAPLISTGSFIGVFGEGEGGAVLQCVTRTTALTRDRTRAPCAGSTES